MRTLTSLLIAALLLMTAAAAPAATVDGATIHWTLMFPDRVKGLVLVGLVQLPATGIHAGQPGRGPLPAVTIASREAMVKGMFGPATTPELQQHILKMMMGTPQATAAGAMAATWDQSQVKGRTARSNS